MRAPGIVVRAAEISTCGRYRYWLLRRWGAGTRTLNFLMLNPSTADGREDDPTIRRCVGFARREDCDGVFVVNLMALRATSPDELVIAQRDGDQAAVGPDNDTWIRWAVSELDGPWVIAWGCHSGVVRRLVGDRQFALAPTFSGVQTLCLGRSRRDDRTPRHPLMVPADTPLEAFEFVRSYDAN